MSRDEFDKVFGKELFEAMEARAAVLLKQSEGEVIKYCMVQIPDLKNAIFHARGAMKYLEESGARGGRPHLI